MPPAASMLAVSWVLVCLLTTPATGSQSPEYLAQQRTEFGNGPCPPSCSCTADTTRHVPAIPVACICSQLVPKRSFWVISVCSLLTINEPGPSVIRAKRHIINRFIGNFMPMRTEWLFQGPNSCSGRGESCC